MADPEYVAELERQVFGLVSTLRTTDSEQPTAEDVLAIPAQRGARLAADSLVGLSIGDALGALSEGMPFDPGRARAPIRLGQGRTPWTDDTQMALSVVDVLLTTGGIDTDRLAGAFARRYQSWRGYGAGMHVLLSELRAGSDWREARYGVFPKGSFGNGSAMRVAPLGAFLFDHPADALARQAVRSAEVTHAHPEGIAGAVAIALAAWLAARSRGQAPPPPEALFDAVERRLAVGLDVTKGVAGARAIHRDVPLADVVAKLGNGTRVSCQDTVPLALWIAFSHLDDFKTAVETAIAAGGDTDTVAAIVGGIVTARVGAAGIPPEWREAVEPLPIRIL